MKDVDCNSLWNLATKIILGLLGAGVVSINPCFAQSAITPDNTLGTEASQVMPNVNNPDGIPSELIEGGAQRGQNLFHSFQDFNVNEERGAYFLVPNHTIQNVLTRVTGNNPSEILGILGTISNRNFAPTNANLFLINPNGIVFGENASLDVNGSFVGTTANAVEFGGGFFSATNPQAPSELLTVNPSAFLFNRINAQASIQNNSVASSGLNPSFEFTARGLRVPDGKSLLLVGGDINMDGGGLFAFGGRVELGGLASAGTVGLSGDGNNLSLSFPDGVERSDVFLSDALVNVAAGDGGSIAVNARNLEMTDGSELFAGIASGLGSERSKAGNIKINATGAINLNDESLINNDVLAGANGQGGDVSISASTLLVRDGAWVSTDTFGAGKGGNLTVNASDVQLIGDSTYLSADAGLSSKGDAGDLFIKTNTLLVRDGAQVSARTFGAGKGGNLTVNASDVQLIGNSTKLSANAGANSTDAGDLSIKTNTLLVRDGAQVSTDTFGAGKGGNLTVNASDVQLIGDSTELSTDAIGDFTELSTGAGANSRDAGNLTLNTNTLLVQDGAEVSTDTFFGAGKGGNLTVNASDVQLIGASTYLSANAGLGSTGDAGDLSIKTNTLLVRDGAQVSTDTASAGKGGNLTVNASDVQLIGNSTKLSANAGANSTDAGDLFIKTNTLLVRDGAQVSARTFGAGKGGNLTVNASDVQLIGDSTELSTDAIGDFTELSTGAGANSRDAGNLTLNTNTLLVQDGAEVSTDTFFGAGKGGNLTVNASDVQLIGASTYLSANAGLGSTGDAGDLSIKTNTLLVRDGAQVSTDTASGGKGGNLTVNTDSLQLKNDGRITAQSIGTGAAGDITLNIKNNFNADRGQVITQAQRSSGGNINITAKKNIFLRNYSDIKTTLSTTAGSGGDITLNANAIVALEGSDILAFAAEGSGGNITFNTPAFFSDPLFRPTSQTADRDTLEALDDNNRVDVNASGRISGGNITGIPDISFLQNSLIELAQNPIDTEALVASSCVVRSNKGNGTFFITGKAGLPYRPGDAVPSVYSAVDVQPVPDDTSATKPARKWKISESIMEPTGVYRLENGQYILSRECGK